MSEIPKLIQKLIDYRDNPRLSKHKIVFGNKGITYGGHLVIDKIEADLPNIRKIKIGARCYNFLADNDLLEGLKVSIILDDNINSHMEFNSVTLTDKPIFLPSFMRTEK